MIELTNEQKRVLEFYKALGANWVATDKNGDENFYQNKPIRTKKCWTTNDCRWYNQTQKYENRKQICISTWESEPLNIDYLLKGIDVDYWKKLPLDTKVVVYYSTSDRWVKRHYAGFEDDKIYYFENGESSWTSWGEKSEVKIDEIRVCE